MERNRDHSDYVILEMAEDLLRRNNEGSRSRRKEDILDSKQQQDPAGHQAPHETVVTERNNLIDTKSTTSGSKLRGKVSHRGWLWEIGGTTLALAAFTAIIVVLRRYDGSVLAHMLYGITVSSPCSTFTYKIR